MCGAIDKTGRWYGRVVDKTGRRYGRLTVIMLDTVRLYCNHYIAFWLCVCDCGKAIYVPTVSLNNRVGHGTKSCGCVHTLPNQGGAFNSLYLVYLRSSRGRGLSFDLSTETFRALVTQPCWYCGREPYAISYRKRTHYEDGKRGLLYTGIDRVDNYLGYTVDNCVPCCKQCNAAKGKLTQKEFFELCKLVTERHQPSLTGQII